MSDVLDEQATWMLPDRGAYRAKHAVRVVTVEQAREAVERGQKFTAGLMRAHIAGLLLPFADHRFRNGKPCMIGSEKGCTCGYYDALRAVDDAAQEDERP